MVRRNLCVLERHRGLSLSLYARSGVPTLLCPNRGLETHTGVTSREGETLLCELDAGLIEDAASTVETVSSRAKSVRPSLMREAAKSVGRAAHVVRATGTVGKTAATSTRADAATTALARRLNKAKRVSGADVSTLRAEREAAQLDPALLAASQRPRQRVLPLCIRLTKVLNSPERRETLIPSWTFFLLLLLLKCALPE